MNYQENELARLRQFARKEFLLDDYVLPGERAAENLHGSIRHEALEYFNHHAVGWWLSKTERAERKIRPSLHGLPTGHLNSSQVACVNHLDAARNDEELALRVAQRIEPGVRGVLAVEGEGFVAYEWIGAQNYLSERGGRTRGANVTSLDALMLVRRSDDLRCLMVFEWKYLEHYSAECVAYSDKGTNRVDTYKSLLEDPVGPIAVADPAWLFYEPYCQLMRQTLLAWRMCAAGELGATDWIHVNVVPDGNRALRDRVAECAPRLPGATTAEAWRSVLRAPSRYRLMSPSEVVPRYVPKEWQLWRDWLSERYLT